MELTREEEKAIKGEYGPGLEQAYKILVAIGIANNATKFIPVKWAHISGVNYNTIGDAGLEFLQSIDKGTKVSVTSTLNPMGFDSKIDNNLSDEFKEKQTKIVNAYIDLGVKPSFTCIPYEIFDLPKRGDYVSFAESNAAVFVNSILGAKTNKESALSALASALTGKTPYSDLLIDEMRTPKIAIRPEIKIESELDYGLLGYFAGKNINESCVGIEEIEKIDMFRAKALSAGMGTSGICGMFSNKIKENVERIPFGREELEKTKKELDTAEKGEIIVFGSPQLGDQDLNILSNMIDGKKFKKRCMIFCPRTVSESNKNKELVNGLKKAGAEIICDACTCLTPLITRDSCDSIVTNSIKGAYYMKKSNKIDVALRDMKTIVKEYCE